MAVTRLEAELNKLALRVADVERKYRDTLAIMSDIRDVLKRQEADDDVR